MSELLERTRRDLHMKFTRKFCIYYGDDENARGLIFVLSSNSAKEKERNIILQTKQPTFSKKKINMAKTCLLSNINK